MTQNSNGPLVPLSFQLIRILSLVTPSLGWSNSVFDVLLNTVKTVQPAPGSVPSETASLIALLPLVEQTEGLQPSKMSPAAKKRLLSGSNRTFGSLNDGNVALVPKNAGRLIVLPCWTPALS